MKLININQTIKQPTGEIIQCLGSGDEYFNWLHDTNGYIIVQDKNTGYYTYAKYVDGELKSSELIVTKENINDADIKNKYPYVVTIEDIKIPKVEESVLISSFQGGLIPNVFTAGTMNNLVIFVRFKGETEFSNLLSVYDNEFNNNTVDYNSMYNYFKITSYDALEITSSFFSQDGEGGVISYEDAQYRSYYQPYNSVTNTSGYQTSAERTTREQTLVANAINAVKPQIEALPINVDSDGDGYVDSVVIIVKGAPTAWNTLLWPHKWALFQQTVTLKGARVWDYNLQMDDMVNVSVLCHEMLHTIGYPDLYHYTSSTVTPVGVWDVMASTTNPPQDNNAHSKWKYGGWIATIPEIETCGTYMLNPLVTPTNNVFKIRSPRSSTEYFIVEYRKKTQAMDSKLPGSGLLVYRIDTTKQGNANGPPDEVYFFRPEGTTVLNGQLAQAYLTSDVGRTSIGGPSNPIFFSNEEDSGIIIDHIGAAGDTIGFRVSLLCCDIAPVKSVDKATARPGEVLSYTVAFNNIGTTTAVNITFTDTLPVGTTFVLNSLKINEVPDSRDVTAGVTLPDLGSNSGVTLTFQVQIPLNATMPNSYINFGKIDYYYNLSPTSLANTSIQSNTVITTLVPASITCFKFVDKNYTTLGDTLTYTIAITSGETIADTSLIDTIPSGTTFIEGSAAINGVGTIGNPSSPSGLNLGTLEANSVSTVIFKVLVSTIPMVDSISNASYLSTTLPLVNSNTVQTTVSYAFIRSTKQADKNYVTLGDTITYTIAIDNVGNVTASNIILIDTLPNGTTYVPHSLQQDNTSIPGSIDLSGVTLPYAIGVGATSTVVFQVVVTTMPTQDTMQNVATQTFEYVLDPTTTPNIMRGSSSTTNTISTQVKYANLGNLTTQVDKVYVRCQDIITYTMGIPNTGNTTATNVVFRNSIPNFTVFVDNSVNVNGVTVVGADPSIGVTLPDIGVGGMSTVSFKVQVKC